MRWHQPLTEIDSALGRYVAVATLFAQVAESDPDATAELEHLLPDLGLDVESLLAETRQQIADLRTVFARKPDSQGTRSRE